MQILFETTTTLYPNPHYHVITPPPPSPTLGEKEG